LSMGIWGMGANGFVSIDSRKDLLQDFTEN